jgi:carboxypeptidase C (cathepsin A)
MNNTIGKWELGFNNSKIFEIGTYTSILSSKYLTGCRNCNKVVDIKNEFKDRQLVGNCYQSLCNCTECGTPMVYDEHKIDSLRIYLSIINGTY